MNPVAVLINKAMIEIPPKFAGRPPVGSLPPGEKQTKAKGTEYWPGAKGIAEDIRRAGAWMRAEAWKRIGHLYPKVKITKEMVKERPELKKYEGEELRAIAWLWARTIVSPNPAAKGAHVPLVTSYWLSEKEKSPVYLEPIVRGHTYSFRIRTGRPAQAEAVSAGTKSGGKANFTCLLTGSPISRAYISDQGQTGRLGIVPTAIVLESDSGRIYVEADSRIVMATVSAAKPTWEPNFELNNNPRAISPPAYGLSKYTDLFTPRQLTTLSCFSDLLTAAREKIVSDALANGWDDDRKKLDEGGTGAIAYADAVAIYLALGASKMLDYNCSLVTWSTSRDQARNTFGRQALQMVWDFTEVNPFAEAAGDISVSLSGIAKALEQFPSSGVGFASQAAAQEPRSDYRIVSTDPPYYDNVPYADLSDFFYVWLRRSLHSIIPSVCRTLLVPKVEELVADPIRHQGKESGEAFFLAGMTTAMKAIAAASAPSFPVTIYYAFKQSDTDHEGSSSSGWEAFLGAVLRAGFSVSGTWPARSERGGRMRDIDSNALASSIVLVCRPRAGDASTVARKELIRELERALAQAVTEMTSDPAASVAPVDLAQAAIGPGMAIFSKYQAVLEADGSPMSVHSALIHINKAIDDYFSHAEGDMDADTRFCIGWFQQHEFEEGPFGAADVLARAKGTSVDGVRDAGVVQAGKGKVRLLRVKEYPASWDPTKDSRLPIWEACHQMCRALGESESEAGALLARMPDKQDSIRQLAYRLYTICERKGWAEDARAYNELVTSWPAIVEESLKTGHKGSQMSLL